jgi:hypothetical protein
MRRRFDGMQRLLQRAGRGLNAQPLTASGKKPGDGSTSEDDSDDEEEEEAPFEPLLLWCSPHQGGEPKGLPTQTCVRHAFFVACSVFPHSYSSFAFRGTLTLIFSLSLVWWKNDRTSTGSWKR